MSKQNAAEEFWSNLWLTESDDLDGTLSECGSAEVSSVYALSEEESALYSVEISDIDFAKELFHTEKLQILLQNNSKPRKNRPPLIKSKLQITEKITETA